MISPIVERELLVAARRPVTHRSRRLTAGAAWVLASGPRPALRVGRLHLGEAGKAIFDVLALSVFAGCLVAGLGTTADCISSEKREGTLGFLFLTDLHSADVVLGKCFATSLGSFFAVLAIVPVLGISFLL